MHAKLPALLRLLYRLRNVAGLEVVVVTIFDAVQIALLPILMLDGKQANADLDLADKIRAL